jgi:hypothetical protein
MEAAAYIAWLDEQIAEANRRGAWLDGRAYRADDRGELAAASASSNAFRQAKDKFLDLTFVRSNRKND